MKTIAGTMADTSFVRRHIQGDMNGALQTTIDVLNAQTMATARQSGLIAIGTWSVKNAL
jgi:hypothetical protein